MAEACLLELPWTAVGAAKVGVIGVLAGTMLTRVSLAFRSGTGGWPAGAFRRLGVLAAILCVAIAAWHLGSPAESPSPPSGRVPRAAPSPRGRPDPAVLTGRHGRTGEGAGAPLPAGALQTAADLCGIVTDVEQEPIAGARVWLSPSAGFVRQQGVAVTETDPDGRFLLPEPAGGDPQWLLAFSPGYVPYVAGPLGTRADEPVSVVLQHGAMISGRVIAPSGDPIEGATVQAWGRYGEDVGSEGDVLFGHATVPEFGTAQSDEDGRFRIAGLPSNGQVLVHAQKLGFASPSRVTPLPIVLPTAEEIVLQLEPLWMLSAVAVDAVTDDVVKHAHYQLIEDPHGPRGAWDSGSRWTLTRLLDSSSGSFTRSGILAEFGVGSRSLEPATVRLVVRAQGYDPRFVELPLWPASEAREAARIRMERDAGGGRLSPVDLAATWRDGKPYEGSLLVRVARLEGAARTWVTQWMAVAFVGGESRIGLPLAPGMYGLRARGHEGSSRSWVAPATWAPFRVGPGRAEEVVSFELKGGIVAIRPVTRENAAIREFSYALTSAHTQTSYHTWSTTIPCRRPDADSGGVLLYLDGGEVQVRIGKAGFQSASTTLSVPDDGGVVTWSPVLEATQE